MVMNKTYEVYFKIALYPKGINVFNFEAEEGDDGIMYSKFIENCEDFYKYLCTENQSICVLNYLRNCYDNIDIADISISDLIFETVGRFNCKFKIVIDENDFLTDEIIQEIIVYFRFIDNQTI